MFSLPPQLLCIHFLIILLGSCHADGSGLTISNPNSTSVWDFPLTLINGSFFTASGSCEYVSASGVSSDGECDDYLWSLEVPATVGYSVNLYNATTLLGYQSVNWDAIPPNLVVFSTQQTWDTQISTPFPAKSTGCHIAIVGNSRFGVYWQYNATNIIARSEDFTILNSSAPTISAISTLNSSAPTTSAISTGTKAGIGIGAALGAIITLAAVWFFCIYNKKHRKHRNQITELPVTAPVLRNESIYRKPELEGDRGERAFHYPGKPELAVAETSTSPTGSNVAPEATPMPSSSTHEATEKELVNPEEPISRIQSPGRLPQVPMPQTEDAAPKYLVVDNLESMRAQERQMASEIDAHESLQRLREEHAALLQRIKEAEERLGQDR